VKRPGPLVVVAQSLSLCGASPPRKWRERTRNTRGAGARSSIGWQTSVGRIARLLHRQVARPGGDQRALAGKKSVAPPDAGRGWTEGETVRVRGANKPFPPRAAFGCNSLKVYDTTEGVLGLLPVLPSPASRSKVLWLLGQIPFPRREAWDRRQRIGWIRNPTRACPRVTMRTSEVDTIR